MDVYTGNVIISGSDDGSIRIWDVRQKKESDKIDGEWPIFAVAADPVNMLLFSGGLEEVINVWDLRTYKRVLELKGHTDSISSLRVHPTNNNVLASNAMDSTVRTWDTRSFVSNQDGKRQLSVFEGAPSGVQQMLLKAVWSPDGTKISAGSGADFTVTVWDAITKRIINKFPGHNGSVNGLCFHPNSRYISSGSSDGSIIVGPC